MSGGIACKCPERQKEPKDRDWEVWQRRCNYSAFNGYHWTRSEYSTLHCKSCGGVWRTNAAYVDYLTDKPLKPQQHTA